MPESEDKELPCEGKLSYESIEEARAADATSSYRYNKPNLRVYKCRHCNLYHLTNQTDDD